MGMNMKDGGPAFPQTMADTNGDGIVTSDEMDLGGISARDYFAAKAMQAMLAGHFSHYGQENYWAPQALASEAYERADAMLSARKGAV